MAMSEINPQGTSIVTRFVNVRVLLNHALIWEDLWIENGKIIKAPSRSELTHFQYQTVDGNGLIIAPGFIDLQVNGGFGVDFSDDNVTVRDLQNVGRRLLRHGVTSFCPMIITSPASKYRKILPLFRRYAGGPDQGASVLGVHLDGPFIAPEKAGAHDPAYIAKADATLPAILDRYGSLSNVSIITMAPELEGAPEAIAELKAQGVLPSIGHTRATYDQAKAGLEAGASMLTRLFSSMSPFHHRDPGAVGLIGDVGFRPYYTLICDGIHAHPTSIRMAWHAHPEGVVLVTDAMSAMGLSSGRHTLGGMDIDIDGIRATVAGTDTLAGSAVDMPTCVRNFQEFTGCPLATALEAATLTPAKVLLMDQLKGRLDAGCDADFVLLNDNCDVLATFIDGQVGYKRPDLRLAILGRVGTYDAGQGLTMRRLRSAM